MKSIYKYYKERLIEISGRNRSLYSKNVSKKYAYDIGKILDGDFDEINDFVDFLWRGRKYSYTLIRKEHKERLYKNLNVEEKVVKQFKDISSMSVPDARNENLRRERIKREEAKKAIMSQVNSLKALKREIEEFSRETGRYEMFIGYPFVEGALGNEMLIKAPLLLFPIVINIENETTVEIELKHDESIQLNKVFVLAYAKHHKLNVDDMLMEFENLYESKLKSIQDVLDYLRGFGFKIGYSPRKGLFNFERGGEPSFGDPLEIKHYCVVGRFPLANSIYNDYNVLEKHKLTNEAIDELLESKNTKPIKKPNTNLYTINQLDYAQENAIEQLNINGNMVIYGPPGTGKSQTIVNVITDALCKHKRVLVVSQKKAALDVVFNRLGILNNKAMYINDAEKDKVNFYERVKNAHVELDGYDPKDFTSDYEKIENDLASEIKDLETLSTTLFTPTPFGISLQEMYANSYMIGKNSNEYLIYQAMLKNHEIMKLNYFELNNTLRVIKEKKKTELYYKHIEIKRANPLVDHIKNNLDVHVINSAKAFITGIINKRFVPFDTAKYPNSRQLLAFYLENDVETKNDLKPIAKLVFKLDNPKLNNALKTSYILFPAYPFVKYKVHKKILNIQDNFEKTIEAVKNYVSEYSLLKTILDPKGYAMTVDNILNGNTVFLKMLLSALNNYVDIRDLNTNLKQLTETEKTILNFAYENSDSLKSFKEVIDKLLVIRIYHELVIAEDKNKIELSKIMDFENIKNRIISLKSEQKNIVKEICVESFKKDYLNLYHSNPENKNFYYQIGKQQNLWPIRRLMEVYNELLFTLFPCWLLSPESVSTIMPLKKNLFDLILFDEASQIFIESTLPTIFRGKYIAVAGDNKQLRPTATFMRRYMGNDSDDLSLSTQAALEVESLLDLATSRYNSTNLTYHYRSKNEELINFSNYAFYDCKLQIAPNLSKNIGKKPIERIMVKGNWINRHNHEEAVAVVNILKKLLKNNRDHQTIGVITFNSEQEYYIEDLIDEECHKSDIFRNAYLKETNRKENGEDVSLFIKNLENVQGDERDIIIFCIGYAQNEFGKVVSHFGPLNTEGGENRLNVAITRAKQKIYVVTSIEPEELNVEGTKNAGPKILKKYLQYVRAVANGNDKEVKLILNGLKQQNEIPTSLRGIEEDIKKSLEKLGYVVETNLGNNSYKLSVAIYDKKLDSYLLGIECDYAANSSSSSIMERDVYRSKFMESRGWKIMRVWSRDWWLNKNKVLNNITKMAEKTREKLLSKKQHKTTKTVKPISTQTMPTKKAENLTKNMKKTNSKPVSKQNKKVNK